MEENVVKVTLKRCLKNIHFAKLAIKTVHKIAIKKSTLRTYIQNCDQKRKVPNTNDKRQNKALKVKYQCEQCKKNFSSNYNLKRHTQTHT